MKKLFLPLLAAMGVLMHSHAATQLRLTLADGSTPAYLLSEKPKITFADDAMLITTPDASVSYARAKIAKMDFTDSTSGIDDEHSDKRQVFSFLNDEITCLGSEISVYDLNGAIRMRGYENLPVSSLTPGCYIVKTSYHTVKIMIK